MSATDEEDARATGARKPAEKSQVRGTLKDFIKCFGGSYEQPPAAWTNARRERGARRRRAALIPPSTDRLLHAPGVPSIAGSQESDSAGREADAEDAEVAGLTRKE